MFDNGIRWGGQEYLFLEVDIEGTGEEVMGKEDDIGVILGGIYVVFAGQGVGWSHSGTGSMRKVEVEIL